MSNSSLPEWDKALLETTHISPKRYGVLTFKYIKTLVEGGANVNAKKDEFGRTPLMNVCWRGYFDAVKFLVENGANINAQSNLGYTPLVYAISIYQQNYRFIFKPTIVTGDLKIDIVKYLIDKGADVNLQDNEGMTPLMRASIYGYKDIVQILIDNRADVNLQDNEGMTPLMRASSKGYKDIVQMLIDNGANIDLESVSSHTAYSPANKNGLPNAAGAGVSVAAGLPNVAGTGVSVAAGNRLPNAARPKRFSFPPTPVNGGRRKLRKTKKVIKRKQKRTRRH